MQFKVVGESEAAAEGILRGLNKAESTRQAKVSGAQAGAARTQWFINEVTRGVSVVMGNRMSVAINMLANKTVENISKPVVRDSIGNVIQRSKPGEFPRADTVELINTLITEVEESKANVWDGYVGSPQEYALTLEKSLNRSFLHRTLLEEVGTLRKIFQAPITVSSGG